MCADRRKPAAWDPHVSDGVTSHIQFTAILPPNIAKLQAKMTLISHLTFCPHTPQECQRQTRPKDHKIMGEKHDVSIQDIKF